MKSHFGIFAIISVLVLMTSSFSPCLAASWQDSSRDRSPSQSEVDSDKPAMSREEALKFLGKVIYAITAAVIAGGFGCVINWRWTALLGAIGGFFFSLIFLDYGHLILSMILGIVAAFVGFGLLQLQKGMNSIGLRSAPRRYD